MANNSNRVLIIGDIHGCLTEFQALLKKISFAPENGDRVVLVGDLVAKGPKSIETVKFARQINAQSVLGNHDWQVLFCAEYLGKLPKGSSCPYQQTSSSFKHPEETPQHLQIAREMDENDLNFMLKLPLYLEVPEYEVIVVHAGLIPDVTYEEQDPWDCMRMRNISDGIGYEHCNIGVSWASLWKGPPTVVFGHDAPRSLQQHSSAIGLDTGCCYGGKLSAFVLPDRKIVQIDAKRVYSKRTGGVKTAAAAVKTNENDGVSDDENKTPKL